MAETKQQFEDRIRPQGHYPAYMAAVNGLQAGPPGMTRGAALRLAVKQFSVEALAKKKTEPEVSTRIIGAQPLAASPAEAWEWLVHLAKGRVANDLKNLRWVGSNIVLQPQHIDSEDVPSAIAVNQLKWAQSAPGEFWSVYNRAMLSKATMAGLERLSDDGRQQLEALDKIDQTEKETEKDDQKRILAILRTGTKKSEGKPPVPTQDFAAGGGEQVGS